VTALPVIFFLDFSLSMLLIVTSIFVQHLCPNDKRGRVMGIMSMANFGMIPLGSLIYYGVLGEWLGPMHMFAIGGVAYLIVTIWYWRLLPQIRRLAAPILVEKELLVSVDDYDQI
jgi:MFS family permease